MFKLISLLISFAGGSLTYLQLKRHTHMSETGMYGVCFMFGVVVGTVTKMIERRTHNG